MDAEGMRDGSSPCLQQPFTRCGPETRRGRGQLAKSHRSAALVAGSVTDGSAKRGLGFGATCPFGWIDFSRSRWGASRHEASDTL